MHFVKIFTVWRQLQALLQRWILVSTTSKGGEKCKFSGRPGDTAHYSFGKRGKKQWLTCQDFLNWSTGIFPCVMHFAKINIVSRPKKFLLLLHSSLPLAGDPGDTTHSPKRQPCKIEGFFWFLTMAGQGENNRRCVSIEKR